MEHGEGSARAEHDFRGEAKADHRYVEARVREFVAAASKTPRSTSTLSELELALFLETEFDITLSDEEIRELDRQDPRGICRTVVQHLAPGNGGG